MIGVIPAPVRAVIVLSVAGIVVPLKTFAAVPRSIGVCMMLFQVEFMLKPLAIAVVVDDAHAQ